jgi:hypothetical protein
MRMERGWQSAIARIAAGGRETKGFGVVAVCLLAIFAIGASVVASASAHALAGEFPEYYKCVKTEKVGKTYSGEYTEKACDTKISPAKTGKYELQEVASGTFEATSRSAALITRTTSGVVEDILCKLGHSRGGLDGAVYATEKLAFEKCRANGEKADLCANVGLETIETRPLFSALAWLNKGRTEAGILLEGEGEQIAKFQCGNEQVNLEGYLVGAIENTRKGHTITFAVNSSKEQAHRAAWVFGAEIVGLNLYTQAGVHHTESTLEAFEVQSGTVVH